MDVRHQALDARRAVRLSQQGKPDGLKSPAQTYIAGESYAGQYIPYIADAIEKTTLIPTRLRGLLIGNGWISPFEQYPAYLAYLEREKLVTKGSQGHQNVVAALKRCQKKLDEMDKKDNGRKGMVLVSECEAMLGVMTQATMKECVWCFSSSLRHPLMA